MFFCFIYINIGYNKSNQLSTDKMHFWWRKCINEDYFSVNIINFHSKKFTLTKYVKVKNFLLLIYIPADAVLTAGVLTTGEEVTVPVTSASEPDSEDFLHIVTTYPS